MLDVSLLRLPRIDGLDFSRALRRMLPDLPVVVTSGWLNETAAREFKSLGVTMHLAKPFTEAQLAEVLKNIFAPK